MTIPTNHAFETRTQIDLVVRQARAARAATIRAGVHNLAMAVKRLFTALRPQAAH